MFVANFYFLRSKVGDIFMAHPVQDPELNGFLQTKRSILQSTNSWLYDKFSPIVKIENSKCINFSILLVLCMLNKMD